MNENHEKLIQVGRKILISSRNDLYRSMKFLDVALNALPYEMNLTSLFVGTDGEKILYNPRFLVNRYLSDPILINRVYLHMLLHCILRHPFHMGERDPQLWNIACDIAVESIIDGIEVSTIQLVVSDEREEMYDLLKKPLKILSAEGIYNQLKEEKMHCKLTTLKLGTLELSFLVDDHVFWDSRKKENQDNQDENENSQDSQEKENEEKSQEHQKEVEEKWQEIGEKTQTNLETFSKDIGEEMGELLKLLEVENRERYDYTAFLRKFMTLKEAVQTDEDAFDYIFYTYGLSLYGNVPLIESLEYKEVSKVEELVIAIDTSESCDGSLVEKFLEQTYTILKTKETFFHKTNIHILQCDTKVQEDFLITSQEELDEVMKKFQLKGNGGTDFRPVFEYIDKKIQKKEFKNLKGLIYFTDGYGTFPKHAPQYDTAFIFFKEEYMDLNVPPWAMKVILGKEDILGGH